MRLILLLSILLLSACASEKNNVRSSSGNASVNNMTSYARSLIGTPYKYGGNSPKTGFDCSGFVGHVFRHTMDISLPRTASAISHVGHTISAGELRAGDLVFFDTQRHKFSHIGIYLGDGHFIHAPSSGGSVRTENMRETYWKTHFDGARRIILHD